MQYAIPEISIDPELIVCQKCICAVAFAIIDCERQISGKNCLLIEFEMVSRCYLSFGFTSNFITVSVDRLSENSHVTALHIH
jgi:hypothetical protein